MPPTQAPISIAGIPLKTIVKKAVTLVIVGVIFGWIYAWASPWIFPRETQAGLGYGVAHGALMPMALPSLVIGKDVDIYAANNSGRFYKIGYIIGINVCGLVFFGSAFWRPAKKVSAPDADGTDAHKNQLR
jgi:hypothetical protein